MKNKFKLLTYISSVFITGSFLLSLPIIITSCSTSTNNTSVDKPETDKPNKPENPTIYNYFTITEKLYNSDRVFGVETILTPTELRKIINESKDSYLDYNLFNRLVRLQTEKELQSFKANPQEEIKNNSEYVGAPILNRLIVIEGESLPMN